MGPFKCPDCGIWWAGLEHRCAPVQLGTGTAPYIPTAPMVWWGHCHACSTAFCPNPDDAPCLTHQGGFTWTVTSSTTRPPELTTFEISATR